MKQGLVDWDWGLGIGDWAHTMNLYAKYLPRLPWVLLL